MTRFKTNYFAGLGGTSPVVGFKAIGATGFGVVRLELGDNIDGNHDVKADQPVGISVYGYGQDTVVSGRVIP